MSTSTDSECPSPSDGLTPEQLARAVHGDRLPRFAEVERFLSFVEGYAMIAAASHGDIPIDSIGVDFLATAAGDAGATLRQLRQEFEAAEGGAA